QRSRASSRQDPEEAGCAPAPEPGRAARAGSLRWMGEHSSEGERRPEDMVVDQPGRSDVSGDRADGHRFHVERRLKRLGADDLTVLDRYTWPTHFVNAPVVSRHIQLAPH